METSPLSVNLMAFPTKFIKTWMRRIGSRIKYLGMLGSLSIWRTIPLRTALALLDYTIFQRSLRNYVLSGFISSLPASNLAMSRMFEISAKSISAESCAFLINSTLSRGRQWNFWEISWRLPKIVFKGFRKSCVNAAKNLCFVCLSPSSLRTSCCKKWMSSELYFST